MTSKTCTVCKVPKGLDEFTNRSSSKDGKHYKCRDCARADCRAWHHKNKDRAAKANAEWRAKNPDQVKRNNAAWYQANKARTRELDKRWQGKNPERASELRRLRWEKWKANNPEKHSESHRAYMRKPERRIARQIWGVIRGQKQGRRWAELLGYGEQELRSHLQRQFLRGMTWDNYGKWHIDHIVPLSSFTITGPDDPELRRAWALSNLRPLWAKDNLRKGARMEAIL